MKVYKRDIYENEEDITTESEQGEIFPAAGHFTPLILSLRPLYLLSSDLL